MTPADKPWIDSYEVHRSGEPRPLFRLHSESDGSRRQTLQSRFERGLLRRIEDAAQHRGISVYGRLDRAMSKAVEQNRAKERGGWRLAPWTHVLEIVVEGWAGDCYARTTKSKGHFTVWGDAEGLESRLVAEHPINTAEDYTAPRRS